MTQPYIDTERDVPLDVEGRRRPTGTCAMCGVEGPVFEGAVEVPDGQGGWDYPLGLRCVETAECRARRHTPGRKISREVTPPGTALHHSAGSAGFKTSAAKEPEPMEPEPPAPIVEEAADVDWI